MDVTPGQRVAASAGVSSIAAELIHELRERIPLIIADTVEMIGSDAPDYAAYLLSDSEDVALAAEEAVRRLVSMASGGRGLSEMDLSPFIEIGRWEWRSGRTLQTLLGAYQAGARVAWRHLSEVAIATGVDGWQLSALAEAIFAFIDDLCAASARGYAEEQTRSAGERERQQLALTELLLSTPFDADGAAAIARRLELTLPLAYAVVAAPADDSLSPGTLAGRLGPGALPVRRGGLFAALVPDPDGPHRHERLRHALAGCGAVVSWGVPCAEVAGVWPVVELGLAQMQRGALPAGDPTFLDEHLGALLVHSAPVVLEVAARRLDPLHSLPASSRERLVETLQAWLDCFGDRQAMAAALHVHPQTIRYRMGQLRGLLGPVLDDPAARFEIAAVLRAGAPKG